MNLEKNIDIAVLLDKQKLILPIITFVITLIISNNIYKAQRSKEESFKQEIREEEKLSELIEVIKIRERKFSQAKEIFGLKDPSVIMQRISGFAAGSRIKILSFSPLQAVTSDVLEVLPFNLRVEGSYHELGNFISKVESAADILKIARFNLSQSGGEARSGRQGEESLVADILINAVFLAE